jgi:hypothetical protein
MPLATLSLGLCYLNQPSHGVAAVVAREVAYMYRSVWTRAAQVEGDSGNLIMSNRQCRLFSCWQLIQSCR